MDNITKMLEALGSWRERHPNMASLWGRREMTMNTPNLRDALMGRVMNIPTLRKTDTQPRQPIQIKDPPGYNRPNVVAARIETHKELLSQAPAGSEEYFRVIRNLAKLERQLHDMYKSMEKNNA
jgi:hypothetical protein